MRIVPSEKNQGEAKRLTFSLHRTFIEQEHLQYQCDQAVPSCGQCRRAHRSCPGYRNEQSLAFRDETKHIVEKVQAANAVKPNKPPRQLELINDFDLIDTSSSAVITFDRTASSTPNPLSASLEDQARCFFFHHFVADDPAPPVGYARYLPTVFNLDSANGNLPGIITSIGLAGLSNMYSSQDTMIKARQKHTAVLRSLNSSLQDTQTATTDVTFVTVLLLGLFEVSYYHSSNGLFKLTACRQLRVPRRNL